MSEFWDQTMFKLKMLLTSFHLLTNNLYTARHALHRHRPANVFCSLCGRRYELSFVAFVAFVTVHLRYYHYFNNYCWCLLYFTRSDSYHILLVHYYCVLPLEGQYRLRLPFVSYINWKVPACFCFFFSEDAAINTNASRSNEMEMVDEKLASLSL